MSSLHEDEERNRIEVQNLKLSICPSANLKCKWLLTTLGIPQQAHLPSDSGCTAKVELPVLYLESTISSFAYEMAAVFGLLISFY